VLSLFQVALGSVTTLVIYGVILAGVYKLFQVATDVGEIKEALLEIKRNTQDAAAPAPGRSMEIPAERLMRAVNAESYPPAIPDTPEPRR